MRKIIIKNLVRLSLYENRRYLAKCEEGSRQAARYTEEGVECDLIGTQLSNVLQHLNIYYQISFPSLQQKISSYGLLNSRYS